MSPGVQYEVTGTGASMSKGYQYLSSLGKGAFAEVYKAIDQTVEAATNNNIVVDKPCYVAIKKLAKHCQSEIHIHKKVKHNNIVQLYNVIHDGEFNYLILELCDGGTLKELLNNRIANVTKFNNTQYSTHSNHNRNNNNNNNNNCYAKIPVLDYHQIRGIIKQLCEALIYLHRNSIIHRDINLNNLLIADKIHKNDTSSDIYVKLADFGLAIDLSLRKRGSIMPLGDTICGTPGFIAPEVVNGQQVPTPSNDAFSVGVVLYSLITGCSRPKRDQLRSTLVQLPPLAADLISSLLSRDPSDRISIEEVLRHPFIIGPISAIRLPFLCKRTNTMEITSGCNPKISSLTSTTSIETNVDGSLITVIDKMNMSRDYTLETLPKVHWRKYHHLSAFVDLVKAKVVKVNFYCNKVASNGPLIERCCLMENGSLEIKISYPKHTMKKSRILLFDTFETRFENQYVPASELKDICTQCRLLERNLEKQVKRLPSSNQNYNIFPATFGQKSNKTRSFCSSIDSKRGSTTENRWNTSVDCGEITEQPSRYNSLNPHVVKFANQSDSGFEFSSHDTDQTDYFSSLHNKRNSSYNSPSPHVVKFANRSDSGFEFSSHSTDKTDYFSSLDNRNNSRTIDHQPLNDSIGFENHAGPPRFIPVQHQAITSALQSLGRLEVSFKDGTKLTILVRDKIVYEDPKNKGPIEVDISGGVPDSTTLPDELITKIQFANTYL